MQGNTQSNEKWAFPWERQTMKGEPMPEGLKLHEQMAFLAMRYIYLSYYAEKLTQEQAREEKQRVRKVYDEAKKKFELEKKLIDYHVKQVRATEWIMCEVRKNPTPENAIRLCNIIDGLEKVNIN